MNAVGFSPYVANLIKPEQETDLTGVRDVGQSMFLNRIEYFILKDPSAQVSQRKARLVTFASNKSVEKMMKQLERERKIVTRCIRRTYAWNQKIGQQKAGLQYL